jgi:hypothetical protein
MPAPGTSVPGSKAPGIGGSAIVAEIQKFVGFPYVYGAAGPSTFDCSGLVQYVLEDVGFGDVPRTSEEQWAWVQRIKKSQLQPGDLVFAQFPGDNAPPGHVGIYTGNGEVLSAEDPALGVGYSSLSSWGSAVYGYGRPPGASISTTSAPTDTSTTGTTQQTQSLTAQTGDVVSQAAAVLHGAAESLNWFFQWFEPGQGWRLAFGAGAVVLGYAGLRTWGLVPAVKGGV